MCFITKNVIFLHTFYIHPVYPKASIFPILFLPFLMQRDLLRASTSRVVLIKSGKGTRTRRLGWAGQAGCTAVRFLAHSHHFLQPLPLFLLLLLLPRLQLHPLHLILLLLYLQLFQLLLQTLLLLLHPLLLQHLLLHLLILLLLLLFLLFLLLLLLLLLIRLLLLLLLLLLLPPLLLHLQHGQLPSKCAARCFVSLFALSNHSQICTVCE